MTIRKFILAMIAGVVTLAAAAEAPVSVGVRAGVNTSNISDRRMYEGAVGVINPNWKCGFLVGAVVDIPMHPNVYLQPGFYYSHRNDGYDASVAYSVDGVSGAAFVNGHVSTNWFHIPVLGSYRFTPLKPLQIQADFGPYLSYGIGGHDTYTMTRFDSANGIMQSAKIRRPSFGQDDGQFFRIDWGFKIGAGFKVLKHYYFGVHYMLGLRNLARNREMITKARSYQWQFVLGYDF